MTSTFNQVELYIVSLNPDMIVYFFQKPKSGQVETGPSPALGNIPSDNTG